MVSPRLVAVLALALLTGAACVPGRCEGGFRMLLPDGEPEPVVVTADVAFWINADASDRSAEALLADSGVDTTTFVLVGPSGPVEADVSANAVTSAHSCASAATFHLKPRAGLSPGEYTLVLRLDRVKWPALLSGEVGTFEGERALVRRYVVR